jgi:hypothetical protein
VLLMLMDFFSFLLSVKDRRLVGLCITQKCVGLQNSALGLFIWITPLENCTLSRSLTIAGIYTYFLKMSKEDFINLDSMKSNTVSILEGVNNSYFVSAIIFRICIISSPNRREL